MYQCWHHYLWDVYTLPSTEQRKKLIELKHHEQQACEQFEKEKTSHDTARQLHQEEKESHNRTKIENNRIKKLLKGMAIKVFI